jgi:hypothetical protein
MNKSMSIIDYISESITDEDDDPIPRLLADAESEKPRDEELISMLKKLLKKE